MTAEPPARDHGGIRRIGRPRTFEDTAIFEMPAETRPDELHDPATLANSLTFRLESIGDEAFRAKWEQRDRMLAAELARSVAAARDAGELAPAADPRALGETLHLALMGAALVGAWRQGETVADRFCTILDAVLGPHRTPTV